MDNIPMGYKKTDIGVIPEDWMVRSVGEIFKVTRGQVLSVKLVSQVTNSLNRYPVYSSQTVNDGLVGYYDSYLYENAITWTTDGANAGIVNYRRGKFYCTNVCGVLLNSQGFANLFMAHKIGSVSKSYVSYVGNPKLMNNVVDKILVAIPPLEEQIAYSQKMSDIESLIVSTEKLIEKKRNIKQGVMQELLTGKRRLAGFKGEWKNLSLGDFIRVEKGSLITSRTLTKGKIPVIAGGKEPAYYHNEANRPANTITISASGANAGFVNFFDIPIFASDCSTISESPKYNVQFIYFWLKLNQNEIYKRQTGGAQPHIHPSDIEPMEIMLPSSKEQSEIALFISDLGLEIDSLKAKLSKLKQIKQGAMQQLLTGKIRLINK